MSTTIPETRTRRTRHAAGVLALAVAMLGLPGCQTPPTEATAQERSVLLQRMDTLLQGAQSQAALRLHSQPDPVTTGQTIEVQISNAEAGYLYLYQVSTDGTTLNMVFPNAVDGANYIAPGTTQLPRASWLMRAKGPVGVGYLVAVLTPQPLNLLTAQGQANQGQFTTQAPYAAASTLLREVAPR